MKGGPTIIHSAEFPRDAPSDWLKGKTVAIIGNGATACQLVEALQPITKKLYVHQRSPKWLLQKPFMTWGILGYIAKVLPFGLGLTFCRSLCFGLIELLHIIRKCGNKCGNKCGKQNE
jgi:hypothetical protein